MRPLIPQAKESWIGLRCLLVVVLAMLCVGFSASATQAAWGPNGECHWNLAVGPHCYGKANWYPAAKHAAIDYVDTTLSDVTELKEGRSGFDTNEMWVSWQSSPYWVETGQIIGANVANEPPEYLLWDEYNPHEFSAVKWAGGFFFHIDPNTVPQDNYEHYLIDDVENNGVYRIYWSGAGSCGEGWCEVNAFGIGASFPKYYNEAQAGVEIATEYNEPYNQARQQVWAANSVGNNKSGWEAWNGATVNQTTPWMVIDTNDELPNPGNIAWSVTPNHGDAVIEPALSEISGPIAGIGGGDIQKEVNGSETILRGSEPFNIGVPTPQGKTPPTGTVLTLVHNDEGVTEDVYLGDHALSTSELVNYAPRPLREGFKQP